MTTFIDFRFSRALATSMFAGQEVEETGFTFSPDHAHYLAIEIKDTTSAGPLLEFVGNGGRTASRLSMSTGGDVTIHGQDGKPLLKTPPPGQWDSILALRVGRQVVGLRRAGSVQEVQHSLYADHDGSLSVHVLDEAKVRILGRGSGRAEEWARLYYHRSAPSGRRIELAMDWHHLRAGIPLFGTMTAEKLIESGEYQLKFRSYAYDRVEAQSTDFVRLFGSTGTTDVALHLTPPLYAQHQEHVPNLGFCVVEAKDVQADLVARCNLMDRICVPTEFAGDALRRSGVRRPIRVVHHGVDTDYFRPVTERRPLPGGRRFNFLAITTHVDRKNIRYLVQAFLKEFREHEDVALFLLLRPEYHTSQQNVALDFTTWERRYARDSAPILLGTGYTKRETLRDFYAHANAYVMPSNEGFGLTLLEAMSSGTPTIGLKYGGVLDFLNETNGYLVPTAGRFTSRDIDILPYVGDRFFKPNLRLLRASMRHVFTNEAEARQKALRARLDCERHFTWDAVTRQYASQIRETYQGWQRPKASSQRALLSQAAKRPLAWVICVLDDEPIGTTLRYLKRKRDRVTRILCLFTRYARIKNVIRARRNAFMFYRWDGTEDNARIISRSVLGHGWIGLLYGGERVDGDDKALRAFLESQPESVREVQVDCDNGHREIRFFRLESGDGTGQVTHCPSVNIANTCATTLAC